MSSVGFSLALPASGALISLAVVRTAGVETWGAFVAVLLVVQLAAQVIDWGSRDALLRESSRDPAQLRALWQTSLVTRALLLVPAPLVFLAFGAPLERTVWLTLWLACLVVARSHEALVAFRRAFGFALVVEIAATLLVVAAVLLAGTGLSVDVLIASFAIAALVRAGLLVGRFGLLSWRHWEGHVDLGIFRRSWPFFALTFSGALGSRVDLYVVALLLPAATVGQYQVLTGLVLLIQALSASLLAPIVPSLYRVPRRAVAAAAGRLFAVGVALTPLAMVAAWLVLITLYRIDLPLGVLIAAWLATLPVYAYLPLVYGAYRDGRERLVLVANLCGIAVAAVGTAVLAGAFGIGGAMLAAAAGQATVAAALIVGERRWSHRSRPSRVPDALPGV